MGDQIQIQKWLHPAQGMDFHYASNPGLHKVVNVKITRISLRKTPCDGISRKIG